MPEDSNTALVVAAPDVGHVPPIDAPTICKLVDASGVGRGLYSAPLQELLQLAWALAVHQRNRQVTVHHVAYALAYRFREDGNRLAEHLKVDADVLAMGCLIRILVLGTAAKEGGIPAPAVGTVRWVRAARVAAGRMESGSEVHPRHLALAVVELDLPADERAALRNSARLGESHYGGGAGARPQPLPPAPSDDESAAAGLIDHFKRNGTAAGDLPAIDENKDRLEVEAEDRKKALDDLKALFLSELKRIEERLAPIGDLNGKLDGVGRQVTALGTAFPERQAVADLRGLVEEIDGRRATDAEEQKQALARIEAAFRSELARVEGRIEPVAAIPGRLATLDTQVAVLGKAIPRPPSGLGLAAAFASVVALGVAAGLALSEGPAKLIALVAERLN